MIKGKSVGSIDERGYYDIVVNIARLEDNVNLSWFVCEKRASFYFRLCRVPLDLKLLKVGWEDFQKASGKKLFRKGKRY